MADRYIHRLNEIQSIKAADAAKNVKSDIEKDAIKK